jgi:hypothetical protein
MPDSVLIFYIYFSVFCISLDAEGSKVQLDAKPLLHWPKQVVSYHDSLRHMTSAVRFGEMEERRGSSRSTSLRHYIVTRKDGNNHH